MFVQLHVLYVSVTIIDLQNLSEIPDLFLYLLETNRHDYENIK